MTSTAISRQSTDAFVDTYGATRVAALRQIYGNSFATGIDGRKTLAEVAWSLESGLLERLMQDNPHYEPRDAGNARSR